MNKFIVAMLMMFGYVGVASAWDCRVWSQSTYPTKECYVKPVVNKPVSVKNYNSNKNTNKNMNKNVNNNTNTNTQDQTQEQNQQQTQTQQATAQVGDVGNGSNNTNVVSNYKPAAGTAYAASLTSGMETCLGSASGGAQTSVFGLTLGGTKKDERCNMRKDATVLYEMGLIKAACFRLREGKAGAENDMAMKAAGVDCSTFGDVVKQPEVMKQPEVTNSVTHEELKEVEQRITTKLIQK